MNENIEREIVRLVKEIAEEEKKIESAERHELYDKAKICLLRLSRKMEVLKLLKKDKA